MESNSAELVYDTHPYDVAIIGAGPAGLSAAHKASKSGLKTIVFEEHKVVGQPVHCGEGLSQFAINRLKLNVPKEALAFKVKGIRIIFPDNSSCIFREDGYDLNKDIFEQYLAVRAQSEGAILKTSSRVVSMVRNSGLWYLNCVGFGARAKAVIDTSGYQSFSNNVLKLNNQPIKTVAGVQYLMEDIPTDGFIDFYLWPNLAPSGYLWVMPKSDGRANVGLVSTDPKTIHKNLKQFVTKLGFENKRIVRPFGGMIPESGPVAKTYSDGLLLAGDAAGFTSPMFEGGTQLALKSGELASTVLADCSKLQCEDPYSEKNLLKYQTLWQKEFPPYNKLVLGKKHFYAYNEKQLNKIAKILPSDLTNMTMRDKLKIGARLLLNGSDLIFNNFFSAMNTFGYSSGENYGW